jgi:predicted flavoprotein YhiN
MIYDVIIIWAWAAWLFAWINLPKNISKLILEKNKNPWVKVLLSGWERANISNIDIEPERDYFGQNKKALLSVFNKYNQWDIQSFFAENQVEIVEEDRWRLILKSWDSRELLDLLIKKSKENKCEIKCNSDVKKIEKIENIFEIILENWVKYESKNVIVSSWWKSFFQVWTTWEWYNFAESFWLNIIEPTRALWWLSTREDLSEISWISSDLKIELFDNNFPKKIIYFEFWPLLFTHFWISWPIIFNAWNAIWEYLNKIKLKGEESQKYILENIRIRIIFDNIENTPKRVIKFFDLENLEEKNIILKIQNFRSWKEAKATGWWVDLNELDKNFMSKQNPWLYFIWEVLDITWKTWGYNLQWARSSAYVCGKSF